MTATRKHIILAAAILSLALPYSCAKEPADGGDGTVAVEFRVEPTATKAVDENAVHSVDLLAFRHDSGTLENHVRYPSGSGTMSLPSGVGLDWTVVCNAPERVFDAVSSRSVFTGILSSMTDNSSPSLVMTESGTGTFSSSGVKVVNAQVRRLMSRVVVGTVDPAYLAGDGTPVKLKGAYLINVAGTCPYDGTARAPAADGLWYNRTGLDSSLPPEVAGLLVKSLDASLTGGTPADVSATLYCYPNPTFNNDNSRDNPSWSPRNTRLVLEVDVDGTAEYYPIDIAATLAAKGLSPYMDCNVSYEFTTVTLLGPGSTHPDIPISRDSSISFILTLTPWSDIEIPLDLS